MDARGLVRSVGFSGAARALRSVRRRQRTGTARSGGGSGERARTPGLVQGAEPAPGGGVVRFARSSLRVHVIVGGAVFCGWDGAEPEPSSALGGGCPEADVRAVLEPDRDGGWRVVSERVTVAVSRQGTVEIRTPGGVVLRRDLPPRWWEPVNGPAREPRWMQRSEVPADARCFGPGGSAAGPRLRDGTYRLRNTRTDEEPGQSRGPAADEGPAPDEGLPAVAAPVLLVVADAGIHLRFHDNRWDGRIGLREGAEGAGSGHDRPGSCEIRMAGGPLRSWTVVGSPARVLHGWSALTGPAAVPPPWALGHQHDGRRIGGADEARRVVARFRERGLPLSCLHLGAGGPVQQGATDGERWAGLPELAHDLRTDGVRLVSVLRPSAGAGGGGPVDGGCPQDVDGRLPGETARPGTATSPGQADPVVRAEWDAWWERLRKFAGIRHEEHEPAVPGTPAVPLPLSRRGRAESASGRRDAHRPDGLSSTSAGAVASEGLHLAGAAHRASEEDAFRLSAPGWAGMQRYGGAWSGGVPSGWPGLRTALAVVLGLGLSGVPFSGPRFAEGGREGPQSSELAVRRLQLWAMLPLFATGGEHITELLDSDPDSEVLACARAVVEERTRLLPYFVTLAHLARRTGAPMLRPLWWKSPNDRGLRDCEDAFLLGDALLVAPALEPGMRSREVRLPRGRWYDTETGRAYEGPGRARPAAPLSRLPVLARAGAVLPVAGKDGGVELEVWPPAAGRSGGGLVVVPGRGAADPVVERYTTRLTGGRVVVSRDDGGAPGRPVRLRSRPE